MKRDVKPDRNPPAAAAPVAAEPAAPERIMTEQTAKTVQGLLVETVVSGSGRRANPETGGAGGKTATAQTGMYDGERERKNVWFAGFFPAEAPRYAIAVLSEDGSSGAVDCAPVFKAIADGILELTSL